MGAAGEAGLLAVGAGGENDDKAAVAERSNDGLVDGVAGVDGAEEDVDAKAGQRSLQRLGLLQGLGKAEGDENVGVVLRCGCSGGFGWR